MPLVLSLFLAACSAEKPEPTAEKNRPNVQPTKTVQVQPKAAVAAPPVRKPDPVKKPVKKKPTVAKKKASVKKKEPVKKSVKKKETAALQKPKRAERVSRSSSRRFVVTAYALNRESTGKSPGDPAYGITASGKRVREGFIACPPGIPFGTRIYFPELGRTCACEDRGGAIKGNKIDLFVGSESEARQFGRQSLEGQILK